MKTPKWLFWMLVPASHWSTSDPLRNSVIGRPFMRILGATTLWLSRGRRQESIEALGREWQRMFPDPEMNAITKVDADTVYGEVRAHCPYRGSGNVEGCYRMMEYDRRMLEKIGGEFVVLRSQAEPGVTSCQVAIRKAGASTADLVPAHVRVTQAGRQIGR
jgi:hypothetical protein